MSRERVTLPRSRSKPPGNAAASAAPSAALDERLVFERMLADLSARFADLPGEAVPAEIEKALQVLIESSRSPQRSASRSRR
jgi:hypothetical protein